MKKLLLFIFLSFSLQADQISDYLIKLIEFKTVSSNKEENLRALKWVEEQLEGKDLYFNYHEFNGHPSLVITTKEGKSPKIFLVSHIDVVEAKEELFHPQVKEGRMYGRGAYDMKMAIACYLRLLEELKASDFDFGIMLTSDEEIGGMNGVTKLLELGYSCQAALLPDGGFNWNFEESAKGVLQVKVSASGKTAHSSRPWNGENAIVKLNKGLAKIESYFKLREKGEYFATANIGLIQGGKALNQVPDYAEAKIDIRFPPSDLGDGILADLQKIDGIEVEKLIGASPNKADLNNPYFKRFREVAKKLYGVEIGKMQAHGSSDARFFGEKGIPVLVITCRGGEIHSDNEWVDLEDLGRFYEVIKAWLIDSCTL